MLYCICTSYAQPRVVNAPGNLYCAFHKCANSIVQKPPSQLRFSLPSIIITITSDEPWNTETHKTDWNPPITNHKPWPFEPIKMIDGSENTIIQNAELNGTLLKSWLLESITLWATLLRVREVYKGILGWDSAVKCFEV